jgi:hypothetical protein
MSHAVLFLPLIWIQAANTLAFSEVFFSVSTNATRRELKNTLMSFTRRAYHRYRVDRKLRAIVRKAHAFPLALLEVMTVHRSQSCIAECWSRGPLRLWYEQRRFG